MSTLADLAPGLMLGCVLSLWYIAARTMRMLRLSLRREVVAVRSLAVYDQMLQRAWRGSLDEDELRLGLELVNVGYADELHAQSVVRPWQRVPKIDKPWPDEMLASVVTEDGH